MCAELPTVSCLMALSVTPFGGAAVVLLTACLLSLLDTKHRSIWPCNTAWPLSLRCSNLKILPALWFVHVWSLTAHGLLLSSSCWVEAAKGC